jgi:tetratricopeptide (TPR) repeat protein
MAMQKFEFWQSRPMASASSATRKAEPDCVYQVPLKGCQLPVRVYLLLAFAGLLLVGCSDSPPPTPTNESANLERVNSQSTPEVETATGGNRDASTAAPPLNREQQLGRIDQMLQGGQLVEATKLLREQLLVDPENVDVLFRLANISAVSGDLKAGVEYLDLIPADNFEAGLPALGQSADWSAQLGNFDEAERRYKAILQLAPDAAMAHRRLGQLFNRQGRRHEAAVHIRELCKLGDFRQDELHALVILSDAMSSEPSAQADATTDYTPIGPSGKARVLFTERRYAEAAEMLRNAIAAGDAPPAINAFYGRVLAEAQDDEAFQNWLNGLTDLETIKQFSEYWSAIATHLAGLQQHEAAARAFLEALDRDPTDFRSMNRLYQMLTLLGKTTDADQWEKRWNSNRKVLLANNEISDSQTPNVEAMDEIASQLSGLGRNLEAVLWKSLEAYHQKLPRDALEHWNRERQKLVATGTDFPNRDKRICDMQLTAFALPNIENLRDASIDRSGDRVTSISQANPAQFRNAATEVGLTHRYELAPQPLKSGFSMYHQTGGGVAVIDYDQDGNPDLYFAQGAAAPPDFIAEQSNGLWRNMSGKVIDVTNLSGATDRRYTIGCTAGDWNQDGFPDLVTANIGPNQLLINNGDGTFTARVLPGSENLERMPASVAIGDLNGDNLPDLVEVNYIQDSEIAMLPEREDSGRVIEAVGPADFAPVQDRIGINDGSGAIRFDSVGAESSEAFRGLGVVIADFDQQPGNDIFIGNDKSPNQLWVLNQDSQQWTDVAMITGAAYSFDGGGTASMGIAAGDFDHSGTLDLHVTNFQNENVCLYLAKNGYFQDRAAQFRLGVPSYRVLGFGSQSLDYDNNGLLDLAVTNGHIDDYAKMSGPFRQKSQLFANLGKQFQEVTVSDPSGYWSQPHLGRAMARIDFNRDGKNDLVVTHLNEPSALLMNESKTPGHWLQLQLVGVESERDAVGAKVTVESEDLRWTEWAVGGDGYLCRNEAVVSFGLGTATKIDRVQIQWPSGANQILNNTGIDHRILVVETDDSWFEL